MELKTVYFEHPGSETTDTTLRIARERAEELDIKKILVASTSGATAVKAMDIINGVEVIVVSHVTGLREAGSQEFKEENRQIIESKKGVILTTAHAFGGLSAAMRNKYNTYVLGMIVADTLRIFGQGVKV
ncbi:MAG: pyruvate kinase alpha/beta domain-containing protein, partial [Dehalococcoidales bacterium]|nr:pyruvate kinase alpha/beta domain-containing protein [Dehalococcoidales bacterium]